MVHSHHGFLFSVQKSVSVNGHVILWRIVLDVCKNGLFVFFITSSLKHQKTRKQFYIETVLYFKKGMLKTSHLLVVLLPRSQSFKI